MLKVYGSDMCPDCVQCKKNFDRYGVEYEFIDINASIPNLKQFLKIRDNDPVFDVCRINNTIGIPALVKEDGTVFLDWDNYLKEKGLEADYDISDYGKVCSLDNKQGC